MEKDTTTNTSVVNLVINGEGSKTTLKELGSALNVVNNQLRTMKEFDNPAEYARVLAQKKAISDEYLKQKQRIGDVRSAWSKFMTEAKTVATGVIGGNFVTWLTTSLMTVIPAAIDKLVKKRDQLADIQRTTNLTDMEVKELDKSLKNLNTRTERTDLRGMASVAGQFNVAKEDIADFVQNVDKANVALKELGGAEQTASTLAKLDNVFKDIEGRNIGDRVLHIANALNVLEASGVATSPVIADFSSRMGRALVPLQVGADKVLGMAAAMEEMNLSAELGSTAVIEAFQKMLTETETFAKVAGMDLKEYKKLINDDIYAAFLKYLEGLKRVKGDQLEFAKALDALKLSGSGAMQTIGAMVDNYDLMSSKVKIAGDALKTTDSIQDEFNKKNYAFAVSLKKLGDWWSEFTNPKGLQQFIEFVVLGAAELLNLVDASEKATNQFESQKSKVKTLEQSIEPLLSRYQELIIKSDLTKKEQTELRSIVEKVTAAVPEAATAFDKYGKAMYLNMDAAKKSIEVQKELLKYYNKTAIAETDSELEGLRKRRISNVAARASGVVREQQIGAGGSVMLERKMSASEMLALDAEIAAQNAEEQRILLRKEGLTGEDTSLRDLSPEERRRRLAQRRAGRGGVAADDTPVKPLNLDPPKKGKGKGGKSNKPITLDMSFETWQEAIDAEIQGWNELYEAVAKEKKEAEQKANEAIKQEMEDQLFELRSAYEMQRIELDRENADGLLSKEDHLRKRAELEQIYIGSQILIKKAAGEQTLDEEVELNDAIIDETIRRNEAIKNANDDYFQETSQKMLEFQRMMQEATYAMQDAMMEGALQLSGVIRSFAQDSSHFYKTILIVERALAISDVIMKTQREIAAYNLTGATNPIFQLVPGSGLAWAAGMSAAAKIRAGISIATISAQTVQDVAFREKGGMMGAGIKSASGYHYQPTLLDYGGRKFAVAEKVPEFVIGGQALQYGPVANFAAMLDSVQKSGNFSALNNLSGGGGSGDNTAILMMLNRLNNNFEKMASRPVVFNYDKFSKFEDFLLEIEKNTSA